jgi:hypothetical protein
MAGGNHWRSQEYVWSPETLSARRVSQRKQVDSKQGKDVDLCPEGGTCLKKASRRRTKCAPTLCQVFGCTNVCESSYYRKYRICEEHGKSPAVCIDGEAVRFCQKVCMLYVTVDVGGGKV